MKWETIEWWAFTLASVFLVVIWTLDLLLGSNSWGWNLVFLLDIMFFCRLTEYRVRKRRRLAKCR